jgi:hypothetical protein
MLALPPAFGQAPATPENSHALLPCAAALAVGLRATSIVRVKPSPKGWPADR